MSDLGGFSMYELFRAEVDTHCAALSDGLLKLESAPDDIGIIVPLMRAAHSIKGAARIVGIDAAVAVAHHMEDALVRIQKGQERTTRGRIDQLLEGTDLLQRISQQNESELPEWSTQNASEINTLTIALSAAPTAAPEPAAAPAPAPAPVAPVAAAPVAAAPVEPPAAPVEAVPVAHETRAVVAPPAAPRRVDAVVQRPIPTIDMPAASAPTAVAAPESRAVRVNADNLDRMMQLAGESMVEGRRSPALRRALGAVRGELTRARESLEAAMRRGDPARIAIARDMLKDAPILL